MRIKVITLQIDAVDLFMASLFCFGFTVASFIACFFTSSAFYPVPLFALLFAMITGMGSQLMGESDG